MLHEAITPYHDRDAKQTQVQRMFDGIAPRYDLLNHLLSLGIDRRWRNKALELLQLNPGDRVLDVATGTADLAILIARGKQCHVNAIDLSTEMLQKARTKTQQAHLEHLITLQQANAEQLPFPDRHFHAATVAFGARNFAHLDQGLAEMARTLRHNAQLLVLEFSQPTNTLWAKLFDLYFANILPRVGGLVAGDRQAYEYLHQSAQAFPSGTLFERHLAAAGLTPDKRTTLTGGVATAYLAHKP